MDNNGLVEQLAGSPVCRTGLNGMGVRIPPSPPILLNEVDTTLKMKKVIVAPSTKKNTVQAIVEYLMDNGMSSAGANMFVHLNIPALGGDTSIMNLATDGKWDTAWSVAEQYMAGDYC